MSEDTIVWLCIGGFVILAVVIIILANWLTARGNQRRANKMMKDMKDGTYDPNKKYMGNQGSWEAGDDNYTNSEYNRH
ncbi:hypothetical protein [Fluviicola sp.]|uniref:hypothetical protein n=1 Tax=Fluviicola sp. TaxID=1917219 RepID=UPI003D27340A